MAARWRVGDSETMLPVGGGGGDGGVVRARAFVTARTHAAH